MKDCTTCKYGFVDEQFGFPMCHHPLRFSEDCVDFNMHEEIEEPEKATGVEEKKLPDGLEEAADKHIRRVAYTAGHPGWDWETQDIAEAFKAGAEWQKKRDDLETADLLAIAHLQGMEQQKAKMMDDIKLAYGKVSMNPFDCSEAFEELLNKINAL